jgi:hypothetical protein
MKKTPIKSSLPTGQAGMTQAKNNGMIIFPAGLPVCPLKIKF